MKKNLLLGVFIFLIFCEMHGQNHYTLESSTQINTSLSNRYIHYQGTFYTQYYGVRYGNTSAMILNTLDTLFYLQDNDAAVAIYMLEQGATSFPEVPNTYYSATNIWGNPPNNIYNNYVLDAYWAALQYVLYLRNHFNCPKSFFQRHYSPGFLGGYKVCDTITPIFIADGSFFDNTHWSNYNATNRDLPQTCYRNAIVIGSPLTGHNPRASIDDVVHEYAHIFSFQAWHTSSTNTADDKLAEACADIWAAIITHEIYPNDEDRI